MDGLSHAALEEQLSDVQVPVLGNYGKANGRPARSSAKEIYRNYHGVIPKSLMARILAREAVGDRSKVLWRIVNDLLEVGVSPGEAVVLVEGSVWNKFGEDRGRLWADVNKAAARTRPKAKKQPVQTSDIRVDKFLVKESSDPRWMIEGLWTDRSHGIIAGEPKTRKSYVAIDIALSVATGTPCLGRFPVRKAGPVYLIQEEISDAEMSKRLRYIAASKGLGGKVEKRGDSISVHLPDLIPLYLRNRTQFDLSSGDQMNELRDRMLELEVSLLILDPLQLILGDTDENKASAVRGILSRLLQLKEQTGSGILIVHHYSKSSDKNPRYGGQRMLGSQAFHGWVESALYLECTRDRKRVTRVEREFRNFQGMPDFEIDYVGGDESYNVYVSEEEGEPKRKPATKFEQFCLKHSGASLKAIADAVKRPERTIRRHIERSDYVMLSKKRSQGKGRPRVIVVRK